MVERFSKSICNGGTIMFLIIAAILLLIVIVVQDYLYPPLREETISDGLYGPYHWYLDAAYVVLATALVMAFDGEWIADVAAGALMVTAITNTFSGWVDKIKAGLHTTLHTWFSILMYISMLGLEATHNNSSGMSSGMWWLSGLGIVFPVAIYGLFQVDKSLKIAAGPAAEKMAVLSLCVWLIVWSLLQ
jgi:hypothetical protein